MRIFALGLCLSVMLCSVSAQASIIIQDDVESGGGWTTIGGGYYTTGNYGLTPTAGERYFNAHGFGSGLVRGVQKVFDVTFQTGLIYTATFDYGIHEDHVLPNELDFGFWIDDDNSGTFDLNKRIISTSVNAPVPVDGTWETWTVTLNLVNDAQNVNEEWVAGSDIGFFVRARNGGMGTNQPSIAFDNLTVSAIPEPGSLFLVILGSVCVWRWRRRAI